MNIHEYQAKQILREEGIPVPDEHLVRSPEEARKVLERTGRKSAVVKVQIHAGGRGKAGGIKVGDDPESVISIVKELLGKRIVNEQTGPRGLISDCLLLSPEIKIRREYYLALAIDRENGKIVLIASPEGGMDIEQIARDLPDRICKLLLPPEGTFRPYQLLRLAKFMNWKGSLVEQGNAIVAALTRAFLRYDAILSEINPLVLTEEDRLLALDAKFVVDENALYRQPLIKSFFDPAQIIESEARALEYDLAYIALDGEIGCMVNGAGLAMATMDVIRHFGGKPANFLDVGGSADKEKVAEGFRIILSDPAVKGILVNIFGGIMNCETLAAGILEAAKDLQVRVPLVVRMEGTNVEEGIAVLKNSKLDIVIARDLKEAALEIIRLSHQSGASS